MPVKPSRAKRTFPCHQPSALVTAISSKFQLAGIFNVSAPPKPLSFSYAHGVFHSAFPSEPRSAVHDLARVTSKHAWPGCMCTLRTTSHVGEKFLINSATGREAMSGHLKLCRYALKSFYPSVLFAPSPNVPKPRPISCLMMTAQSSTTPLKNMTLLSETSLRWIQGCSPSNFQYPLR